MKNVNTLEEVLLATHVNRMHVIYGSQDTVGRHSCGVALLCEYLTDGAASKELLLNALCHDLAELHTGDVPATAKWASHDLVLALRELESQHMNRMTPVGTEGPYSRLSDVEESALKLADMLELLYFCRTEVMRGNRHVQDVGERVENAARHFSMEILRKPSPLNVQYHQVIAEKALALINVWKLC